MSNQLQNMALSSLSEFEMLLRPVDKFTSSIGTTRFHHPGFIIRLVLDGTAVKFEPDFHDFEVILINVFDVMLKAVTVVPCVETKLYSEWSGQKKYLKPNILETILEDLKNKVAELVKEQSACPIEHAKRFIIFIITLFILFLTFYIQETFMSFNLLRPETFCFLSFLRKFIWRFWRFRFRSRPRNILKMLGKLPLSRSIFSG